SLAELLETLGRDRDPAAAAEVRLRHLDDGDAAVAEDPVVVAEHGGGQRARQLTALAPDRGEVDLGAAQLLAKLRLLGLALGFTPLEAPLRVLDLTGQTLGLLHEVQDLLLDPGLLLLDVLDLGEDRGILLVGLDLIKLALVLLPLDAVVLEVLLLGALA